MKARMKRIALALSTIVGILIAAVGSANIK